LLADFVVCPGERFGVEVERSLDGSQFRPLLRDPTGKFFFDGCQFFATSEVIPFVRIGLVVIQFLTAIVIADVTIPIRANGCIVTALTLKKSQAQSFSLCRSMKSFLSI
jgi:hypothetical protein